MKEADEKEKNYFTIESSLRKEKPDTVAVIPAVFDNKTVAVIELGKFGEFSPLQKNARIFKIAADSFQQALAIVHRIITKHGGTVRAEGKTGHGTTIFFTFPV